MLLEIPVSSATRRTLQWVAPLGLLCRTRWISARHLLIATWVRGRPGRNSIMQTCQPLGAIALAPQADRGCRPHRAALGNHRISQSGSRQQHDLCLAAPRHGAYCANASAPPTAPASCSLNTKHRRRIASAHRAHPPFQGYTKPLNYTRYLRDRRDLQTEFVGQYTSRLRKKGIPQPAPSLSSLPVGREVKESSHLLCRVWNRYIRPGPQESLFPHPARESAAAWLLRGSPATRSLPYAASKAPCVCGLALSPTSRVSAFN